MIKQFENLCNPAKIYLIIAIISSVLAIMNGVPLTIAGGKLFFAGIWTWVLKKLCKNGYESVSWVLVALPYVIIGLTAAGFQNYSVVYN